MRECRVHIIIVAVLSLAAAAYQVYYVHHPLESVYADMRGYIERAWDLVGAPSVVPYERFYPPGTHYLFALVFAVFGYSAGFATIALLQILFLTAANVFSYQIAVLLFSNNRAALVLASVLSVFLPRVALVSFYVAEPLFLFLITSGQLLLLHALTKQPSRTAIYVSGLLFGFAIITKGQALAFTAGAVAVMLLPRFRRVRRLSPLFVFGAALPVVSISAINSNIAGRPMLSVAANDMFNSYLGQSQRRGIGCYDDSSNTFYFFHNNNSYFNELLSAPMAIRASILDRDYFRRATLKLWSDQPLIQLVRSLNNIRELFLPELYWPLRDVKQQEKSAAWSAWIWSWVSFILGSWGLALAVRRGRWTWQICFITIPLLGIAAMAFVSMGQPRYLVPFQFHIMLLSMPVLCSFDLLLSTRLRGALS